jgi:hypothetical protein
VQPDKRLSWRADASYLITGGLGDLGLITARWLVEQGTCRLILLGRGPLPDRRDWATVDSATTLGRRLAGVRQLEALGASVHLVTADMGDEAQLAAFLQNYRSEGWPPIRGVFHLAGTVHGGPLASLDPVDLAADFRSKAVGAWLLHRLLADCPLDLFVMYSSGASLMGSPLLAGYAAANAFLDGLAHHRHQLGLPALAINWGFWSEAGLALRHVREHGRDELPRGMKGITNAAGLTLLPRLLQQSDPQVAVLPFAWSEWAQSHPDAAGAPLLKQLLTTPATGSLQGQPPRSVPGKVRGQIVAAPAVQRPDLLRAFLGDKMAEVLGCFPSRLPWDQPAHRLGLDSLMAVQIKHWIETELGVNLPLVRLLEGHSMNQLAELLLEELLTKDVTAVASPPTLPVREEATEPRPVPAANGQRPEELLRDLDRFSDQDVENLLSALGAEGKVPP